MDPDHVIAGRDGVFVDHLLVVGGEASGGAEDDAVVERHDEVLNPRIVSLGVDVDAELAGEERRRQRSDTCAECRDIRDELFECCGRRRATGFGDSGGSGVRGDGFGPWAAVVWGGGGSSSFASDDVGAGVASAVAVVAGGVEGVSP